MARRTTGPRSRRHATGPRGIDRCRPRSSASAPLNTRDSFDEDQADRQIGDYALIGNCRSAALVSRNGAIEWLCWPRFESPSFFGALLDAQRGGAFAIRPVGGFRAERRYVEDTNVLETTFHTSTGSARLIDLMPVASERDKARTLTAQHEILRSIECLSGEIAVIVHYAPRPNYARDPVRLRDRGPLGIHFQHGAQLFALRSEIALQVSSEGLDAHAEVTLRQGDRRHLSLTFSDMEPGVLAVLGASAEEKIRASVEWWRGWAAGCAYQGPYRAAVMRSALVLKLLTYAPSGAVIAAPTTSLPEKPGGVRNWDYRYCWLRDASLTLQALHDLGYLGEAQAHMAWLLHATRLTWPRLRLMYDVFGRPDLPEECLDHLAGFAGSRPVRIGNAATRQLQLDVYGELLDAVYQFTQRGGRLDRTTARMLRGFGETVCRCWREPDEGIWETRGGRRHHTFSRVMCWVALDRLLKLHEAGHVRIARDRLSMVRDEIRQDVERRGFDESLQSYVAVLDGNAVDASLLQLARYGYVDARSTRMRGTLQVVRSRLGRDGLIYRYRAGDDGLPSGEGAFGICGFWAVDALARSGDVAEAVRSFEHLLKYANDVGLYAEETAPESGAALGNFPQAFTHVGLICAALTLAQASGASS